MTTGPVSMRHGMKNNTLNAKGDDRIRSSPSMLIMVGQLAVIAANGRLARAWIRRRLVESWATLLGSERT